MKLGELIEKLELLREEHGDDLPVIVRGDESEVELVGAYDEDGLMANAEDGIEADHIFIEGE